VVQVDAVRVAQDTFKQMIFMESVERREFTPERIPNAQKPQKTTKSGVPLWSVKVAAINWRGNSSMLSVTVPSVDSPSATLAAGELVDFDGLVFGVTPKRDGSGFSTWCSADAIVSAKVGATV
jgi:hypothetical protein